MVINIFSSVWKGDRKNKNENWSFQILITWIFYLKTFLCMFDKKEALKKTERNYNGKRFPIILFNYLNVCVKKTVKALTFILLENFWKEFFNARVGGEIIILKTYFNETFYIWLYNIRKLIAQSNNTAVFE